VEAYVLTIEDAPDEQDVRSLSRSLVEFNLAHSSIGEGQRLAVFVRDEQREIVAGVSGWTWGECLEVHILWVHADLRGKGYGKKLLCNIEERAVERGCSHVVLDTLSFQAPGFYKKLGYEVWAVLGGYPDQCAKFYMRKQLNGA
jgi:ribosomal protein S18 acetylase RimI-like enzyme